LLGLEYLPVVYNPDRRDSELHQNNGLSHATSIFGFPGTRARVTQIMNLLKLSAEMQVFLLGLNDAKQVRKYSERKLRG
jgi:hypothetical protein